MITCLYWTIINKAKGHFTKRMFWWFAHPAISPFMHLYYWSHVHVSVDLFIHVFHPCIHSDSPPFIELPVPFNSNLFILTQWFIQKDGEYVVIRQNDQMDGQRGLWWCSRIKKQIRKKQWQFLVLAEQGWESLWFGVGEERWTNAKFSSDGFGTQTPQPPPTTVSPPPPTPPSAWPSRLYTHV